MRWLLVSAQDDASARAQVLPALSRCTVLVPTMTGAPDKLRYLAQSGGAAMVLFTGHDALEHASKKLGWAQGTQSVSFRAIGARDALEMASLHGTRAVIVDAAAEHALELRYDEVSMYLSRGTAEFAPDFVEPSSRATGEYGMPQRKPAPSSAHGTGEYGLPPRKANAPSGSRATGEASPRITGDRSVADVREEVAPRKARDARRDDDDSGVGGGMRERVERAMAASEPTAQSQPARVERLPRKRGPDQPTQPMENSSEPVERPQRSSSSTKTPRKRNLAEIDDPFVSSTPRQAPVLGDAGGQARRVPSLAAPPLSRDMPSTPFESSRPPSSPTNASVAASPVAPAVAPTAAPVVRRMPGFNYERDQTVPLKDVSNAQAARDSAARAGEQIDFAHEDLEPEQPPDGAAHAELGEAVLSAIADALRKFPEAEWACVLPDEGANIIGVRVDPSYLQRSRNIESAIANAARKAGELVQPLIVSAPAATKDARSRGRMFFPWKTKR